MNNVVYGIALPGSVTAIPSSFTERDQLIAVSTSITDVKFTTNGSTIIITNTGRAPAAYMIAVAPQDLGRLLPGFLQPLFQRLRSFIA